LVILCSFNAWINYRPGQELLWLKINLLAFFSDLLFRFSNSSIRVGSLMEIERCSKHISSGLIISKQLISCSLQVASCYAKSIFSTEHLPAFAAILAA
jgi:hypothetical protein